MINIKRAKRIKAAILAAVAALTGIFSLSACGMDKEHSQAYEEVLQLTLDKEGEEDWKPTGQCVSWGMETPNYYDKYYFYIDKDKYYDYKEYWLEDVPREKYREGFNESLWETGDYAQHCINIKMRNYTQDSEYMGIKLKKDTEYYIVSVYDKALYYVYINGFEDENNFIRNSGFRVDKDSCIATIIYHKNGKDWVAEEADPKKIITKNSDSIFDD